MKPADRNSLRTTARPDPLRAARGSGRGVLTFFLLLATFIACPLSLPAAGPETFKEYQVKAVFLFNFAQFVEWPADAFPDEHAPITIGVLGEDPFGKFLDQTVEGETAQGRKLVIKRSARLDDLKHCHVLFIGKSEKARLAQILASLGKSSVLTVGEIEGFARRGGIINFYMDGNKVRFEINADAAHQRNLKISSQLLKLGRIVSSVPGGGKD